MRRRDVRIFEREGEAGEPGYWVVEDGGIHDTAVEALERVKSDSARRVRAGGESEVVVIEWHPVTRVGRVVVAALQRG